MRVTADRSSAQLREHRSVAARAFHPLGNRVGAGSRRHLQPHVRPHLRLVDASELTPRARRRRAVALLVALVSLVAVALFSVVIAHVVLTEGQFRLDQLSSRVASERAEQQHLQLVLAQLRSASHIIQTAEQRIGMVVPSTVTYLQPMVPGPGSRTGQW